MLDILKTPSEEDQSLLKDLKTCMDDLIRFNCLYETLKIFYTTKDVFETLSKFSIYAYKFCNELHQLIYFNESTGDYLSLKSPLVGDDVNRFINEADYRTEVVENISDSSWFNCSSHHMLKSRYFLHRIDKNLNVGAFCILVSKDLIELQKMLKKFESSIPKNLPHDSENLITLYHNSEFYKTLGTLVYSITVIKDESLSAIKIKSKDLKARNNFLWI